MLKLKKGSLKLGNFMCVLVIFTLFISNFSIFLALNLANNDNSNNLSNNSIENKPFTAVAHAPIMINGESELSAFTDKSGSGTAEDPYIIENLEITSTTEAWGAFETCIFLYLISSHVIIRNIIIDDISDSTDNHKTIYIDSCNNTIIDSVVVKNMDLTFLAVHETLNVFNCSDLKIQNVDFINISATNTNHFQFVDTQNFEYSNISYTNILSDETKILYMSGCSNGIIDHIEIKDFETDYFTSFIFFQCGSDCIDLIIKNCVFMNLNIRSSVYFYYFDDTTMRVTFQNNLFQNITVVNTNSNMLMGSLLNFDGNTYRNIVSGGDLNLFYLIDCIQSNFTNNLIDSLKAIDYDVHIFTMAVTLCTENLIFNNQISNISSVDGDSYCLSLSSYGTDNDIYYNRFMGGSIIAVDNGGNNYIGPIYFEPLGIDMFVGNYWYDHQFDGSSDMHYFVQTPRDIEGNGNSTDTLPLHYFGMDFDNDGLNNFEEDEIGTDIWNPDTDGDGIIDSDDAYPLGGNMFIDFFSDVTNTLLFSVAVLLGVNLIVILVKGKLSKVKTKKDTEIDISEVKPKKKKVKNIERTLEE